MLIFCHIVCYFRWANFTAFLTCRSHTSGRWAATITSAGSSSKCPAMLTPSTSSATRKWFSGNKCTGNYINTTEYLLIYVVFKTQILLLLFRTAYFKLENKVLSGILSFPNSWTNCLQITYHSHNVLVCTGWWRILRQQCLRMWHLKQYCKVKWGNFPIHVNMFLQKDGFNSHLM